MERKGVIFEFGWPSFEFGGIYYSWPNDVEERHEDFFNRRENLVGMLSEKFRDYSLSFGCRRVPRESVILGEKGITVTWMNSGRWIELWKMMGANFVAGHNLDSWKENAVAFNLASDVLEYLSPEILAPRVNCSGGEWQITYPLPEGVFSIRSPRFSNETLQRLYSTAKFESVPEIETGKSSQIVKSLEGNILIGEGCLRTEGFSGRNVSRSSYVASRLMSLTDPNF